MPAISQLSSITIRLVRLESVGGALGLLCDRRRFGPSSHHNYLFTSLKLSGVYNLQRVRGNDPSQFPRLVEVLVLDVFARGLQAGHAVKINQKIAGASENTTDKKHDKYSSQ